MLLSAFIINLGQDPVFDSLPKAVSQIKDRDNVSSSGLQPTTLNRVGYMRVPALSELFCVHRPLLLFS